MTDFHAVILDAGSTGTRPFIYRIQPGQVTEVLHNGKPLETSSDERGIHKLLTYSDVKEHLDEIFTEVKETLELLIDTPIPVRLYLLATAGVRDNLNAVQREALRVLLTNYIQGLGFDAVEYTPISGTDEAKYGWIAANHSQGRPYNAGYVEMGGASAQIALPLEPRDYEDAGKVVKNYLDLANKKEMQQLYGGVNDIVKKAEIAGLQGGEMPKLEEVVELWAIGTRDEKGDWREPGDIAKLEEVVKLWGGEMTQLEEVVRQWGLEVDGMAKLEEVVRRLETSNKAKLEDVGSQKLFLASYPLGKEAGYKAYKRALFRSKREGIQDKVNKKIFYDPSKRNGYEKVEAGGRIIKGRKNDNAQAKSNAALTFYLVGDALQSLYSDDDLLASRPLDPVVRRFPFIGAANFWYSMHVAVKDEDLSLGTLYKYMRDRSVLSQAEFRLWCEKKGLEEWLIEILDNEIFTTTWALSVLRMAFGLELKAPGSAGQEMTFTPYNGPDKNRFSWTLGMAVLLASPNLDVAPAAAPAA